MTYFQKEMKLIAKSQSFLISMPIYPVSDLSSMTLGNPSGPIYLLSSQINGYRQVITLLRSFADFSRFVKLSMSLTGFLIDKRTITSRTSTDT